MTATSSRPDLSHLAKRWWRTTNNLIATALIVIVGLALGREVVQGWWQVRVPQQLSAEDHLTPPPLPVPGPFESSSFVGTSNSAVQELAERCRHACAQQARRQAVGTIPEAALSAGRQLGEYDGFDLYLAEGEPPMMAAVSQDAHAASRDVYCWGFALPADEQDSSDHWNLYISASGILPAQEH